MTSDGRARTRVEAMDAQLYNVGHLRMGRCRLVDWPENSFVHGKKALGMHYVGGAFTKEPPRVGAFGLVQPRRRPLYGPLIDQANGCEVRQFVEIAGVLGNMQFLKVWR